MDRTREITHPKHFSLFQQNLLEALITAIAASTCHISLLSWSSSAEHGQIMNPFLPKSCIDYIGGLNTFLITKYFLPLFTS